MPLDPKSAEVQRVAAEMLRMSADRGMVIEFGWLAYKQVKLKKPMPPTESKERRKLFFCGAQNLFVTLNMISKAQGEGLTEQELLEAQSEKYTELQDEFEAYAKGSQNTGGEMERGWASLAKAIFPANVSDEQRRDSRTMFFEGGAYLFDATLRITDDSEDASVDDIRRYESIQAELNAFGEQLRRDAEAYARAN